jgi:hypothetical protein
LAGSLKVGNAGFNCGTGEVDNSVDATRDANPKLALWEEVGGKVR